MTITLSLFAVGFFILIKGANVLVKEGAKIAKYLGVSSFVIGTLIAGIGTSIPEFAVTFFSNISGKESIGLGTIIGSNIFNILFILGLCSLLYPMYLKREWVTRDLIWNIGAIAITAMFAFDGVINRVEGLIMLTLCSFWIITVARNSREKHEEGATSSALVLSFLLSVAGLVGVLLGSYFVVNSATAIATDLGVSQTLVGLLIVGIGTSLPEIIVSVLAASRREYGIAIGNIIGSNIFDFLGIIGFTAIVLPFSFENFPVTDLVLAIVASITLLLLAVSNKNHRLGRVHGLILLTLFFIYLKFIISRG